MVPNKSAGHPFATGPLPPLYPGFFKMYLEKISVGSCSLQSEFIFSKLTNKYPVWLYITVSVTAPVPDYGVIFIFRRQVLT